MNRLLSWPCSSVYDQCPNPDGSLPDSTTRDAHPPTIAWRVLPRWCDLVAYFSATGGCGSCMTCWFPQELAYFLPVYFVPRYIGFLKG